MNIIYFTYDSNYSGSNISMIKLIIELKKYNINPIIVFPKKGDAIDFVEKNNLKYYIIKQYSWTMPIKIKIKKILKKEHIDIIHINNAYLYLPCIVGNKSGIKIVWHLREFIEEDQGNVIFSKKYATKVFNKATKAIAISDAIYDKYYDYFFNKNKLVRIYNGIDINDFYYNKNHAFKNKIINILIPATLMCEKGQHELLYATKEIVELGIKNIHITLAGRNIYPDYFKYITKLLQELKINTYVDYIGFNRNIKEIMKKSDIVCICSKLEAFGRTTIEAMLSNCLVIGSNTGGTRELIKNNYNGLLYRQGDYKDLANKIIYAILEKKKMQKIINNGREFAKNKFSSKKNYTSIYNLYKALK